MKISKLSALEWKSDLQNAKSKPLALHLSVASINTKLGSRWYASNGNNSDETSRINRSVIQNPGAVTLLVLTSSHCVNGGGKLSIALLRSNPASECSEIKLSEKQMIQALQCLFMRSVVSDAQKYLHLDFLKIGGIILCESSYDVIELLAWSEKNTLCRHDLMQKRRLQKIESWVILREPHKTKLQMWDINDQISTAKGRAPCENPYSSSHGCWTTS
jgi:hypothetical protein